MHQLTTDCLPSVLLVTSATGCHFNHQLTKHMKENDNTEQQDNRPFPIPEPPMWLGMALAALMGGIFVSLIIVIYELTH